MLVKPSKGFQESKTTPDKGKMRKIEQGALQGFLRAFSKLCQSKVVVYGDLLGSLVDCLSISKGYKAGGRKVIFLGSDQGHPHKKSKHYFQLFSKPLL